MSRIIRKIGLLAIFVFSQNSIGQVTNFIEPNNTKQLLKVKFSVDNSFSIYPNYSVLVYESTKRRETEEKYTIFKQKYPNTNITIINTEKKFKLFAGNFENKIEAFELQNILKFDYPNSYMVRLK